MDYRWHYSIVARTGFLLVGALALLSAVILWLNAYHIRSQTEQATQRRLEQLLDTVENTASIACFTNDEVLARELANGLLRNSEVQSVVVRADETILASASHQSNQDHPMPGAEVPPIRRQIYSPFAPDMPVGMILLTPNQALIDETVAREMRAHALQVLIQLLGAALVVALVMLFQIICPITSLSVALNQMDAATGERLKVPKGHQRSEIGSLVANINCLADRLVESLAKEQALRLQHEIDKQRYHAIFENAETGLFTIDDQGLLTSWNPAFHRLMNLSTAAQSALNISLFALPWKEPARLAETLLECLSSGRSISTDLQYFPEADRECWLSLVLTPLPDRSLQGVVYDVTERLRAEHSAKALALTDPVTGLANRLGLERRLQELGWMYERELGKGCALILIGLDNFKRLREGLDPATADAILQETAKCLVSCLKGTDLVARIETDQFALLLVDLTSDVDAERVAERLLKALSRGFSVNGVWAHLQASAGIAFYPRDGGDSAELIHHAELALASVDARGINRIRFFAPELAQLAEQRRRLEMDLRRAIQENQFVLYYQPIVSLTNHQVVGAEVLVRWQHPERGLVPPHTFIPLAEETGLINDLGLIVIEAAARQLAAWQREGRDWYLSVNVSPLQIPNNLAPDKILQLVQQLELAPHRLALEVTEGVLLDSTQSIHQWLEDIRASGFPIFLDDFGTGYSSLSYLKRFVVDRLKVDRSFVRHADQDPSDQRLLRAIMAMAEGFGIEVIAEGVEGLSHIEVLRSISCRYAQGYYFSPPVPIDSFLEVCERLRLS